VDFIGALTVLCPRNCSSRTRTGRWARQVRPSRWRRTSASRSRRWRTPPPEPCASAVPRRTSTCSWPPWRTAEPRARTGSTSKSRTDQICMLLRYRRWYYIHATTVLWLLIRWRKMGARGHNIIIASTLVGFQCLWRQQFMCSTA